MSQMDLFDLLPEELFDTYEEAEKTLERSEENAE